MRLNATQHAPRPAQDRHNGSRIAGSLPSDGHPASLPPLPPIKDKAIELAAFTLPAFYHAHTLEKVHLDYNRLEFLGDAYIEIIASRFVFSLYPDLPAGRLCQQRELIVKNETLAEYALAYGFDRQARGLSEGLAQTNRKLWVKTMGDIFEAYVAAIIMSDPQQGMQTADSWLTTLWKPKLSSHKKDPFSAETTFDPAAKTDLAKMVLGKGIKLEYLEEKETQHVNHIGKYLFTIGVYITGWGWEKQHLGSGVGLNKLSAGSNAATQAMENPLTHQIQAVKKEFDAKVAAERALQEQQVEPEEVTIEEDQLP